PQGCPTASNRVYYPRVRCLAWHRVRGAPAPTRGRGLTKENPASTGALRLLEHAVRRISPDEVVSRNRLRTVPGGRNKKLRKAPARRLNRVQRLELGFKVRIRW